jgi:phage-related protein
MAATLNFKFVANAVGLKKGVDDASKKLTGFQKTTEGVSKKLKAAIGAVTFVAVIKGLTDAAKAASEDEIAQNKLALQIKTSTDATDAQIKSNEDFISATSRSTGVLDDVLRPALANAVRGTGDLKKGQDLLKIALDGAAATGKPLDTVLAALTKSFNGNNSALYKLAPQLKTTKGGIEDFAKSVSGAAGTSASPFAKFSVALNEAKETIGKAFLPVIQQLIQVLGPLIDKVAPTLAKLISGLAPIFTELVKALQPLIDKLLPPIINLLSALMPIIIPIAQGLTAVLIPTINILAELFKGIATIIDNDIKAFSAIGKAMTDAFKVVGTYLTPTINVLVGLFKGIVTVVGSVVKAFGGIGKAMTAAFKGVGTFLKGLFNGFIGMIEGFVNFFIDGINMIPKGLNSLKFKVPDWVPLIGGKTIGFKVPTVAHIKIPKLAQGGVVMPSPGGSIVNVAEAGQAEAIIPLNKLGNMNGGNTYVININKASITGEEIVRAIRRYEVGQGRTVTL